MHIYKETLDIINRYSKKPEPFEPGEKTFWDHPHISRSMLEAHLSQNHDAASRKAETIDRTIDNLFKAGALKPGMRLLDLGCGPGLYAQRLAMAGMEVVGVDISERSIGYARAAAEELNLPVEYHCVNFFDLEFRNEFDAVIQVYGELNTFPEASLVQLLAAVRKALKEDGVFIFDVSTRKLRSKNEIHNNWYYSDQGFWRPGRHMVLEMCFDYPDRDLWLNQYIIIDESGCKVYRNWFHDYSLEAVEELLSKAGFKLKTVWNDLTGSVYTGDGEWIAVIAQKNNS